MSVYTITLDETLHFWITHFQTQLYCRRWMHVTVWYIKADANWGLNYSATTRLVYTILISTEPQITNSINISQPGI
jgi:hypothetical protein